MTVILIQDFPQEILVNIFKKLKPSDVKNCSKTCRKWKEPAEYAMYLFIKSSLRQLTKLSYRVEQINRKILPKIKITNSTCQCLSCKSLSCIGFPGSTKFRNTLYDAGWTRECQDKELIMTTYEKLKPQLLQIFTANKLTLILMEEFESTLAQLIETLKFESMLKDNFHYKCSSCSKYERIRYYLTVNTDELNLCLTCYESKGRPYQMERLGVDWKTEFDKVILFFNTCNSCFKHIEGQIRYCCMTCDDFKLCTLCYVTDKHPHQMEKIGEIVGIGSDYVLGRYTQNLIHARNCTCKNCCSTGCQKMKRFIRHSLTCDRRKNIDCSMCKQLFVMCAYHAELCIDGNCTMKFCPDIKLKMKLQKHSLQEKERKLVENLLTVMKNENLSQMEKELQILAILNHLKSAPCLMDAYILYNQGKKQQDLEPNEANHVSNINKPKFRSQKNLGFGLGLI